MNKNQLPPREQKIRLPSARIPKSLYDRVFALLQYRGEWTAFVIEALTREVERREKEQD